MAQTYIVIDQPKDWSAFFPSERVITFSQYLNMTNKQQGRVRVINLCKSTKYLSDGYYCSLLAESRGHHVMPSVRVLNDISKKALYKMQVAQLLPNLAERLGQSNQQKSNFIVCLGILRNQRCKNLHANYLKHYLVQF